MIKPLVLVTGSALPAPTTGELEVVSRPPSHAERRIKKLYSDLCGIGKEVSTSIIKAGNRALPIVRDLGGALIEQQKTLGYGNWEAWIKTQEFGVSTAKRWMSVNRRWDEVTRSGVSSTRQAYLLLGLISSGKAPQDRSHVNDLTEAAPTDTPATRPPLPEKLAVVAQEPDDIEPPIQGWDRASTEPEPLTSEETSTSEDSEAGAITCYKVDALLTIRVTRRVDAHTEEEAIQTVKRLYGGGLARHLEAYQNCDKVEICSMTWSATT
jgi:hypothetical protein